MVSGSKGNHDFWVVCEEPEDPVVPLTVGLTGLGETLPVFSFEEEALLYLGARDTDGLRTARLPAGRLLMLLLGRWSGFGSVALDPISDLDADLAIPLTTMSRARFVRFLASYQGGGVGSPAAAAL